MNRIVHIVVLGVLLLTCCIADEVIETEVIVGHSAELPCNVTAKNENDRLSILAWYRNESAVAFYSRDLRDGAENSNPSPDSRYRLVTSDSEVMDKLQIVTVRPSDAGLYHCLADFEFSPAHKTNVQLVVIEPPRHLWVIHENGTQVAKASAGVNVSRNVGPYYVGDTVHLFCVAFGGNPQATLSWWTEQRLLKNSSTTLSEQRVRTNIMFGPLRREDHGRVLTCYAKNNERTKPLSIDIIINMLLPPELVSIRAEGAFTSGGVEGRVRTGEAITLQCRVIGAHPPPPLLWKLDDSKLVNLEQNITMEPSQRLIVSEVQWTIDRRYDESRVTCCALNYQRGNDTFECAQGIPLIVLYPPVVEIIVEGELNNNTLAVAKGSNVTLACSYLANPSVDQIMWFHEDAVQGNEGEVTDKLHPILDLKNISESDAGKYMCTAHNEEGFTDSEPIFIDVTYPAYCENSMIIEYGLGDEESINMTCNVKANPEPISYRWISVNAAANITTLRNHPQVMKETDEPILVYERPNNTAYSTVFCWGLNGVPDKEATQTPCTYLVTDETIPRPPSNCEALITETRDIIVNCEKGHSGGLPQRFKFFVKEEDTDKLIISIVSTEPEFKIAEPKQERYKFTVIAVNDKGESDSVEILKEDIINNIPDPDQPQSAVANITTLSLALCGGVALVALAACGLVLCAHDRGSALDLPRPHSDPPLCAYNTEESNCETYHGSEDGSECNVRRTESFRRAVSRYPSKNFDVRRTSSFHSARYANDTEPEPSSKCNDVIRYGNNCRVHSLQNISRKRDTDALCDHLVLHLPPETSYGVPKPMNTFYTIPRKTRQKQSRELSDETSEITQTSDGFSLPPPPDEFGTYRAATRIRDIPKATPTYTTVVKKNSTGKEPVKYQQYNDAISSMNTVGVVPTISATQASVYTYPDDDHRGHQETPSTLGTASVIPTYKAYFTPRECGL
ncbi:neural cell adhesion molecule 2 isoform X2 [Bombyx mori]|uniref:Ig-like domain-containing protein n=1 Tax=Bombyx mori TaxID=7091 RepID=A0A8R2G7U3_BOMMO|nr:neural cell adhesion molecule 2 isoform X2 [Bombyx mori]